MNKALLVWVSLLAGLQVASGSALIGNLVPAKWAGVVVLGTAALQAATATYQKGLMTPVPGGEKKATGVRRDDAR